MENKLEKTNVEHKNGNTNGKNGNSDHKDLVQKKFLFISWEALSGDLAWRLKQEGHEVKFYTRNSEDKETYDGFIDKVDNWEEHKDWADVICYHKDTKVLTKKGWMFFYDLHKNDFIATLNKDGYLVWKKPTKLIKKYFKGDLFSYESEQVKFAVTPKHNMYVRYRKKNRENFSLVPIDEIYNKTHIEFKKDCNWNGIKIKNIIIPKYEVKYNCGSPKILRNLIFKEKKYNAKLFMKFLGFYIAEGCIKFRNKRTNPTTVSIGQNSGKILSEFQKILRKLDIKYSISKRKNNFYELLIHNCQLANYLLQFNTLAENKSIPEFFKGLSKELLMELYEWFKKGDGSEKYVCTSSRQLANDLIEIGLKIGISLKITTRPAFRMKNGYNCKEHYILIENRKKITPVIRQKKRWKKISYNNFVYCVEVPNHVIYTNYKGTAMWCGNCFDDSGFGKIADSLRKSGKLVIGCTEYTDRLEEDREFGQNEMKRVGMQILPHWDFIDFDEAIKFIKENPGRYVFKPSGVINADQKGILFIGQEDTGEDLIEILEHNKKTWSKKIRKFQLQKYAQGVEIAVGAFFNGKDFIYPINVNFEHKKLFPGDIGPYTGEQGTLMYWSEPNNIFKMTLEKMKGSLAAANYIGYVDINCIVNGYGIYPLEWTCRFGYPTISIQLEGILTPINEWLWKLANGESFSFRTKRGFQVGVVIGVPPWPYKDKKEFEIYRECSIVFRKPNLEGVHLGDIKSVDGDWYLAVDTGYLLVVTGSGTTVEEARKQTYNRIKNIMMQNMYYRTDIGEKWSNDSDKLHTWGYIH